MIEFILNDKLINTDLPAGMVMVDFIRYHQHLVGTKIGCREGDCGACTILTGELMEEGVRYRSVTSCLMPLANARQKHIVTIEGINMKEPNAIQQAMCDEGATQCGFCTPGIVMSLAGFCLQKDSFFGMATDEALMTDKLMAAVDGNICRCTGYKSIERASFRVGALLKNIGNEETVQYLTRAAILPSYFSGITERLQHLRDQVTTKDIENDEKGIQKHASQNGSAFLGGGTDLYVQQPEVLLHHKPDFLFDRAELKGISFRDNKCFMGASTTVSEIFESPVIRECFPNISRYAKLVSSTPIRNMATVAGNFINASPIGDLSIFFLALDAQLQLVDNGSSRELPLKDLYLEYKVLAKKPAEYIKEISFTLPSAKSLFNFEKVSKRTNLDIATVNTAISITVEGDVITSARLSAGGVSPIPLFLAEASAFLQEKRLTVFTIRQAIEQAAAEISPISDVRGTATYKRLLLKQLIKAHFITLFPHLDAEELLFG